jgi:hypothetical protein
MTPITLYQGSSYNALGDHRYQIISQLTPTMGISVLGPVRRSDALFGLPHVEEEGCHIQPEYFEKVDPSQPLFKAAAIQLLTEQEHPWLEPYHGIRFRTVGYLKATDAFQDWNLIGVRAFAERIQNHGLDGIQPDAYHDEEWRRRCCIDKLNFGIKTKAIELNIKPEVPGRTGDPCVRSSKPGNAIFCYFYNKEWGDVIPPESTLKKVEVSGNDVRNISFQFDIEMDKKILRGTKPRNSSGTLNFHPI